MHWACCAEAAAVGAIMLSQQLQGSSPGTAVSVVRCLLQSTRCQRARQGGAPVVMITHCMLSLTSGVLHGACAACRALRTQQFLAFTAADLANRDAKQKALLQEFEASRKGKLVSKAELDDFYQRLQVTEASMRVPLMQATGIPTR